MEMERQGWKWETENGKLEAGQGIGTTATSILVMNKNHQQSAVERCGN